MGIRQDLKRLREVVEEEFGGLTEHIKHGDLGSGVAVPIPDLPEYVYGEDTGSIVQGDPTGGQGGQPGPYGQPQPGQGQGDGDGDPRPAPGTPVPGQGDGEGEGGEGDDEGDGAGEGGGEHGYMDMDDEEFAELLEDELEFELDPTEMEEATEEQEGDIKESRREGPETMKRSEEVRRKGIRRKIASYQEKDYAREIMKIDGVDAEDAYNWARNADIDLDLEGVDESVSPPIVNLPAHWFSQEYEEMDEDEQATYEDFEEFLEEVEREPVVSKISRGEEKPEWRKEDEIYKAREIEPEEDNNLVVVNIRDVSGSMAGDPTEFTERIFWPINKYLKGKYDNGVIIYIAHDHDAWEVEETEFWGMTAGGGTRIESAYELTQAIFEGNFDDYMSEEGTKHGEDRILTEKHPNEGYPVDDWNRYVFGAGDGGNFGDYHDLPEIMSEIEANRHGYVDIITRGNGSSEQIQVLEDELGDEEGYVFNTVNSRDDIIPTIKEFLDEKGDYT
jgi:uncharacterized sporulation protein YeaH/YhbH (DUF444 family)